MDPERKGSIWDRDDLHLWDRMCGDLKSRKDRKKSLWRKRKGGRSGHWTVTEGGDYLTLILLMDDGNFAFFRAEKGMPVLENAKWCYSNNTAPNLLHRGARAIEAGLFFNGNTLRQKRKLGVVQKDCTVWVRESHDTSVGAIVWAKCMDTTKKAEL